MHGEPLASVTPSRPSTPAHDMRLYDDGGALHTSGQDAHDAQDAQDHGAQDAGSGAFSYPQPRKSSTMADRTESLHNRRSAASELSVLSPLARLNLGSTPAAGGRASSDRADDQRRGDARAQAQAHTHAQHSELWPRFSSSSSRSGVSFSSSPPLFSPYIDFHGASVSGSNTDSSSKDGRDHSHGQGRQARSSFDFELDASAAAVAAADVGMLHEHQPDLDFAAWASSPLEPDGRERPFFASPQHPVGSLLFDTTGSASGQSAGGHSGSARLSAGSTQVHKHTLTRPIARPSRSFGGALTGNAAFPFDDANHSANASSLPMSHSASASPLDPHSTVLQLPRPLPPPLELPTAALAISTPPPSASLGTSTSSSSFACLDAAAHDLARDFARLRHSQQADSDADPGNGGVHGDGAATSTAAGNEALWPLWHHRADDKRLAASSPPLALPSMHSYQAEASTHRAQGPRFLRTSTGTNSSTGTGIAIGTGASSVARSLTSSSLGSSGSGSGSFLNLGRNAHSLHHTSTCACTGSGALGLLFSSSPPLTGQQTGHTGSTLPSSATTPPLEASSPGAHELSHRSPQPSLRPAPLACAQLFQPALHPHNGAANAAPATAVVREWHSSPPPRSLPPPGLPPPPPQTGAHSYPKSTVLQQQSQQQGQLGRAQAPTANSGAPFSGSDGVVAPIPAAAACAARLSLTRSHSAPGNGGGNGSGSVRRGLFEHHRSPPSPPPLDPETNLYVNNLPRHTTDESFYDLASSFGGSVVSHKAIIDPNTGECKGFGFAMFESTRQAEDAIRGLSALGFSVSRAKQSFTSRLRRCADRDSSNLYIHGLPADFGERELKELLHPLQITSARVLKNVDGSSKGSALARMDSRAAAEQAIEKFGGMELPSGERLVVRFADSDAQRELKRTVLSSGKQQLDISLLIDQKTGATPSAVGSTGASTRADGSTSASASGNDTGTDRGSRSDSSQGGIGRSTPASELSVSPARRLFPARGKQQQARGQGSSSSSSPSPQSAGTPDRRHGHQLAAPAPLRPPVPALRPHVLSLPSLPSLLKRGGRGGRAALGTDQQAGSGQPSGLSERRHSKDERRENQPATAASKDGDGKAHGPQPPPRSSSPAPSTTSTRSRRRGGRGNKGRAR